MEGSTLTAKVALVMVRIAQVINAFSLFVLRFWKIHLLNILAKFTRKILYPS